MVNQNHSRSKNPVWYNFSNFHFSFMWYFFQKIFKLDKKKIKNSNFFLHFIILAIFQRNKCKIKDLLAIFFFAFFASFSLQRIFFANIFFVCKESLLGLQYTAQSTKIGGKNAISKVQKTFLAISKMAKNQFLNWEKV